MANPTGPTNHPDARDPEFDAPAMRGLAGGPSAPLRLKQPSGLRVLFMTEMWERFSFYGMKALLVLYLIKAASEGGLGWSKEDAGNLMGWYAGLVYLTPMVGGYLADRFLGTHRCLLIGGSIIAAGHFTLMLSTLPSLYIGLGLVIAGTGFFKSNVSTMVGQLYPQGDRRRDAGFTIFYMGINLGAFIAPLACGWLRTRYGWSWGFGAAGVGMVFGLLQYLHGRKRYLAGIGDPPSPTTPGEAADEEGRYCAVCAYDLKGLPPDAPCPECGSQRRVARKFNAPLTFQQKQRVAVIFIMAFFVIFFWTAFEQAGTSMAFFAEERTNRTLPAALGWAVGQEGTDAATGVKTFPAEWFQSVNPLMILILAPLFASIWVRLAARGREPSTPAKMAMGLVLLGGGFFFMVAGARLSDGGILVSPLWLVAAFLVHTCAELCLSPVGLSLVTKLAPWKFASLLMGVWFLANFVANFVAGRTAGQIENIAKSKGFLFGGQADFFLIFVIAPIVAGLVLFTLVPMLKKMMHGRG